MNDPQQDSVQFMEQASQLARDITAMRGRLSAIAITTTDVPTLDKLAVCEERLHLAHIALCYTWLDIATVIKAQAPADEKQQGET